MAQETSTQPPRNRNQRSSFQGRRSSRRSQGRQKPPSEYDQKILDIARVSRVTAGGRRFSFRVTMIVGNKTGKVGVATGKGKDVAIAVNKAARNAQKNIFVVPMTPEGTIPHEVEGKRGSARVTLRPTKGGRGIIAGGPVRIICELAGYKDISAKIVGRTTNKLNNARATIEALSRIHYTPPVITSKQDTKKQPVTSEKSSPAEPTKETPKKEVKKEEKKQEAKKDTVKEEKEKE